MISVVSFFSNADAPEAYQLGLQDPATIVLEGMILFHDFLLLILLVIGITVCWLLFFVIKNYNSSSHPVATKFTHSSLLEIIWTIIPAVILLVIAAPSFVLLYSLDDYVDPSLTLKIIGHQWYWSYEVKSHNTPYIFDLLPKNSIEFDSYMISTNDLTIGAFRLLEVDNRIILPVKTHIRLLVTAADVLHSWAMPSFGIKVDACPGRLSEASLFIKRKGVFYGQCSEICGVNHGFMPIVVKAVTCDKYWSWLFYKVYNDVYN